MTDSQSSSVQQAAILLMSLSPEEASEVLKHLDPKEVQKIGAAMANLSNVPKAQVENAIKRILENTEQQTSLGIGKDTSIRNMFVTAFGEDKGSHVVDSILMGTQSKGLDALKWMDPKGISDLIRLEHPQIQALILSQLEPDVAAQVINYFEERLRLDLIMRISSQETIQPMALDELNTLIEKQLKKQNISQAAKLGGTRRAAEIISMINPEYQEQLMESLKDKDQDLANEIQDLMFVFENLLDIDDRGIQALLREISTETLILALKAAEDKIKTKIFSNMSKRASDLLKDDLEAKGPVKLSEVEQAQKEIMMTAKRMADAGEINIGGRGSDPMV